MTAYELLGLEPTWVLSEPSAATPLVALPQAVALEPTVAAPQATMQLGGPSTLTLALIGVGALAIYRGVQHRLSPAPKAARELIKPRRRAA